MNIGQAIKKTKEKSAKIEADIFLSEILNQDKAWVLAHPEFELNKKQVLHFEKMVQQRLKSLPVAYIVGYKEFYGLNFLLNKNVLIPRPETELIVSEVVKTLKYENNKVNKILDIGTGSGCVAVSLAKNLPEAEVVASDISALALRVVRINAKRHGVLKQIKFIRADLLSENNLVKNGKWILIANLPYLPESYKDKVQAELNFEPERALYAGSDGLKYIKKLLEQVSILKNQPKYIFLEIDPSQLEVVKKLVQELLPIQKIQFIKDLAGRDRIVKIDL